MIMPYKINLPFSSAEMNGLILQYLFRSYLVLTDAPQHSLTSQDQEGRNGQARGSGG
jgi:hypothetical protein